MHPLWQAIHFSRIVRSLVLGYAVNVGVCARLRRCSAVAPRLKLLSVWEPFISTRHNNSSTSTMSDKKQTVDLGLLEEDDEFEEFPAEGEILTCYVKNLPTLANDFVVFGAGSCSSDSASLAMFSYIAKLGLGANTPGPTRVWNSSRLSNWALSLLNQQ